MTHFRFARIFARLQGTSGRSRECDFSLARNEHVTQAAWQTCEQVTPLLMTQTEELLRQEATLGFVKYVEYVAAFEADESELGFVEHSGAAGTR